MLHQIPVRCVTHDRKINHLLDDLTPCSRVRPTALTSCRSERESALSWPLCVKSRVQLHEDPLKIYREEADGRKTMGGRDGGRYPNGLLNVANPSWCTQLYPERSDYLDSVMSKSTRPVGGSRWRGGSDGEHEVATEGEGSKQRQRVTWMAGGPADFWRSGRVYAVV